MTKYLYGRGLWDEMNQYFSPARGKEELGEFLYRVDVEETVDKVYVTMEIPGLENKDDLVIEIDERKLTIRGEVKSVKASNQTQKHQSERYYGAFVRNIFLPAEVKADGAHASYRNGVLQMEFLKDSHPAARTIEVDFH